MSRKVLFGIIITLFIALFTWFSIHQIVPEEIENAPEWMSLDAALERAAASDKYVMIDIFEVGCQFCRKMDRETYPAPSVRAALDRGYYAVKINGHSERMLTFLGEEMMEREFAVRMGVSAYPFVVLMKPDGTVMDRRRGYQDVVGFTRFLNSARQPSESPS
ncbi:MAG: DUF255 domain-containing protein [Balneolaceae bacterium]|nr:MAG: DUF255 domain-containing protein [Balneolaceae bacterium]